MIQPTCNCADGSGSQVASCQLHMGGLLPRNRPNYDPPNLTQQSLAGQGSLSQAGLQSYAFTCEGCGTSVPTMMNGPTHRVAECIAYHKGYQDGLKASRNLASHGVLAQNETYASQVPQRQAYQGQRLGCIQ